MIVDCDCKPYKNTMFVLLIENKLVVFSKCGPFPVIHDRYGLIYSNLGGNYFWDGIKNLGVIIPAIYYFGHMWGI